MLSTLYLVLKDLKERNPGFHIYLTFSIPLFGLSDGGDSIMIEVKAMDKKRDVVLKYAENIPINMLYSTQSETAMLDRFLFTINRGLNAVSLSENEESNKQINKKDEPNETAQTT